MALALGKTVDELLTALGPGELAEWVAYSRIEPIGAERAALEFANQTAHLIARIPFACDEDGISISQCLLRFEREETRQPIDQQRQIAECAATLFHKVNDGQYNS